MEDDFTAIPILDLSLARSPTTKPQFLAELRNALVCVGFLYVRNHSLPEQVQQEALQRSMAFFDLPLDKKLEMETVHSKHFLGYNRIDAERTGAEIDHNESIAIGPNLPAPGPEDPVYLNLQGPSQWPDETALPGFRSALEGYLSAVQDLAADFTVLVAEALDLASTSLTRLFDDSPFSRLKVMRYPPPSEQTTAAWGRRGVGPHKDGVFMTYLLQGGEHECLEVQNKSGAWIPVPPIPGTLVINIGRLLETLTAGVCTATTHRVHLRPEGFIDRSGKSLGPRISIPFFQHVNLRLMPEDLLLDIPPPIANLVKGEKVVSDADTFFSGLFNSCAGDTIFVNMLTSYQDVARKWFPDLLPLALKKQSEAKQLDQQQETVG
ncbi:2OG-Fe(II) oxygenase superfamily protein [Hirsutella rhossiliensis]|uniref:2OG-Fe(II) oxygenase superfamily domain-containing protein n=1 Tax=Hirsutella rhossiliensis TaxID=111463 RepID=A0A9P8N7Y6_9HYPO|nr:2OG-Fe(II) oxygenase superfamily domain-containing protein [Hirsutella rhossiliensis]KAH0968409.1 2OG-Fe(II) oxygenase superfamily domain-containing protein [Hirsutella rhossiliensis]